MLQNFRDNLKGVTAFLLVGIIIIPFALFGVDSIFLSGSSVEKAATVNGEPITQLRVQQAVALRKQQIMSRFQDISPELIDDEQLKAPVLQELIRQKALELEAADMGMAIPQKRVYQSLLETDAFQTDGAFDAEKYDFLLRQQGYTPNSYSQLIGNEMLINQFISGVVSTGFATEQEMALLAEVAEQTRNFYYLTIPAKDVLARIDISDDEIAAHYEENNSQFMSPEKVVVDYIELSAEQLKDEVEVDEAQLEEQFEAELATLQADISRHVAHILIEPGDDQAETIAKLQQQLESGEDFAALAREYSMDYGTAESGGDLGFSRPGDLPESLETALSQLNVGEISAPVSSEAGTHLLKLIEVKTPAMPTFEERREALAQTAKNQLAMELLLEKAEQLRDLSYNAESLEAIGSDLGLPVKRSNAFSRAGIGAEESGINQYPAVVKAAFSDDVLNNGYASEVLELGEDRVLVLSLSQHIPSAPKPLSDVAAEIKSALAQKAAQAQILQTAESYLERLNGGATVEQIAKAEGLDWQVSLDTRRVGGNLNAKLREYVFSLPLPDSGPVTGGLFVDSNDYLLVSLTEVVKGDINNLPRVQRQGLSASSALASAGREFQAYQQLVLDTADVSQAD